VAGGAARGDDAAARQGGGHAIPAGSARRWAEVTGGGLLQLQAGAWSCAASSITARRGVTHRQKVWPHPGKVCGSSKGLSLHGGSRVRVRLGRRARAPASVAM
jgi:hypothetical protein